MVEPVGVYSDGVDANLNGHERGGKLYVATDKASGTGPNNFAQRPWSLGLSRKATGFYVYRDAVVWVAGGGGCGELEWT